MRAVGQGAAADGETVGMAARGGPDPQAPAGGRPIGLIGVPASAGAHWPGQERASAALRRAGLVALLERAGRRVVDHVDLPAADVPQHNAGLTLREAATGLRRFAASPSFAALTVTEFNPDHADEEGRVAAALAKTIAATLRP